MRQQYWLAIAALLLGVGVALGAFGAHALRGIVAVEMLANWQTAVQYHFLHAIALLVLALHLQNPLLDRKGSFYAWGLLLGIILFSGSLYLWVITAWYPLVFVTPIGGSVWLITWMLLFMRFVRGLPEKTDN